MGLVLLGVGILAIIAGVIINVHTYEDGLALTLIIIGVIVALIGVVATLACGILLTDNMYVDEKIEMYEEENKKIEQEIADVVNRYIEHEAEVMNKTSEKIEPGDSMCVVLAYPELNSSELIAEQIKIYYENNNKIKELKEDKINIKVYKWWLYFGN